MWLSLVERCVRDAEAAGSNPAIQTIDYLIRSDPDFFMILLTDPADGFRD